MIMPNLSFDITAPSKKGKNQKKLLTSQIEYQVGPIQNLIVNPIQTHAQLDPIMWT